MKTAFLTRAECIGMDIFDLRSFLSEEYGFDEKGEIKGKPFEDGFVFTQNHWFDDMFDFINSKVKKLKKRFWL